MIVSNRLKESPNKLLRIEVSETREAGVSIQPGVERVPIHRDEGEPQVEIAIKARARGACDSRINCERLRLASAVAHFVGFGSYANYPGVPLALLAPPQALRCRQLRWLKANSFNQRFFEFITLATLLILAVGICPRRDATRAAAISAPKQVYFRAMTYNIHVGFGMDKKLDLRRIADVIMYDRPDLVGLQEVDRGVRRTEGRDEIAELARLTGMEYAFAPNLDYQGGKYGVAILSRYPILAVDHWRYANKREAERRGFVRVEVMIKGRKVNFVTTHLDYQFADGRLFETEQLLKGLEAVEGPIVVAGDFNDEPNGSSYALMISHSYTDAWHAAMKSTMDGYTYPADKPVKRIDYIFAGKGVEVHGAVSRASLASDHLPLLAGLSLR